MENLQKYLSTAPVLLTIRKMKVRIRCQAAMWQHQPSVNFCEPYEQEHIRMSGLCCSWLGPLEERRGS
jgi:hypothetical protein